MTNLSLEEISRQVTSIVERLSSLEKEVRALRGDPPAVSPPPVPTHIPKPRYVAPEVPPPSPAAVAATPTDPGKVLASIAVVCFVLGGSFFVKLAIDSGWLTPIRQLAVAAVSAFVLIGVGIRFRKTDATYFSFLPAAGVVVLYITAYAGHLFHGVYDEWVAMGIVMGTSILSLFLFGIFENIIYALVAVIGSYSVPLLIPALKGNMHNMVGFFLVCDIFFSLLAIFLRNRAVMLLAAYLAIGGFAVADSHYMYHADDNALFMMVTFEFIQFLIFLFATGYYTIKNRAPLNNQEALAYLPLLLIFYGIQYNFLSRLAPDVAPWLSIALSVFLYGVYGAARKSLSDVQLDSAPMLSCVVGIMLFHGAYLELMPESWGPIVGLLLIGSLPLIRTKIDIQGKHFGLGLVFLAIIGLEALRVVWSYGATPVFGWMVYNFAFAAAFFAIYALQGNRENNVYFLLLFVANFQAMVGLYRLTHQFATRMEWLYMERFLISLVWGVFAIAVLLAGKFRKDRVLANSSLVILGVSVAKVFLLDTSSASAPVRVACFLTLGVVLYLGGFLFRRVQDWNR